MNNEKTINDELSEIKNVEMKDGKGISIVWLLPFMRGKEWYLNGRLFVSVRDISIRLSLDSSYRF